MTDREIDDLICHIQEMARRIDCEFHPDPDKLMAFRCTQREHEATKLEYQRLLNHR